MIRCEKCSMLKITEKGKCGCSYGIKIEKKETKEIKKISEKKQIEVKKRGSLKKFYLELGKKHFNEKGDGNCMYCGDYFNINNVLNNLICFAHILDKGDVRYKHLTMYENNIGIVCSEKCHKSLDAEICKLKIKDILKEKIENGEFLNLKNLKQYVKKM